MPFIQWIEEKDATGEVDNGYEIYFTKLDGHDICLRIPIAILPAFML